MKVVQLVNSLDLGDAVSLSVFELATCLTALGYETAIHARLIAEGVARAGRPIEELRVAPDDVLLLHFAAGTPLMELVLGLTCRKVLVYHNITPPEFFADAPETRRVCVEGRSQLASAVGRFDAYVGVSAYNCDELAAIGCPSPSVLPIVFDPERLLRHRPASGSARADGGFRLLFVGRVAPNKRFEDVIRVFDHLRRGALPDAQLVLVGECRAHLAYYDALVALAARLGCAERVVFTGKVDDATLAAHYARADAFLSMSAHEGFCLPLLESMAFGVPTFAYGAGAVRETMGEAGVLIVERRLREIAELIHVVTSTPTIRQRLVQGQHAHIRRFSRPNVSRLLAEMLARFAPARS
jgi:glycosyltransferase involved in cell wall biosynthesis